jgi:hypothetical protein
MALNQTQFHFGQESGAEATYPVLAADNFGVMLPPAPGRTMLCRIGVQATGGVAHANTALTWQYEHTPKATGTPSAWTNITTTSAVIRTGSTTVFANGANCTKRLTSLTGTFEASGAGCTHDGSAGGSANDIAANGCSETLIGLGIVNADTAVGDRIRLRVINGGGPLASYTVFPEIVVGINLAAIQARDTTEQITDSVPVAKIVGTQVMVAVVGLNDTDLADTGLAFTANVWGTTVQGSTDPADYTTLLQGPYGHTLGTTGTKGKYNGLLIPPEFAFSPDVPEGIKRVLVKVQTNKAANGPWGVDGTIMGDV